MSKTLIIAEKPSVAADIASAVGGFPPGRHDVYENDRYVISSAIGHLVELCRPGEMDSKHKEWSLDHLPILPPSFALRPIAQTKQRLDLLLRLLHRNDVERIVNACDAGREGELIFRYLIDYANVRKPVDRLWLQSMTPEAIRQALHHLRPQEEMEPLAQAALCRSESDWLIGINGTRALTALHSKPGGFSLTPVGRVQTPTLAIVVKRDREIQDFHPRNYWEVHAIFQASAGSYPGRWFDPALPARRTEAGEERPERIWEEAKARAIREKCLGKTGPVTEERKAVFQAPPALFDLTSLQREANGRFGFSAKRTLQVAQALYETHKALTYPRTDSRHLPEDYQPTVRDVVEKLIPLWNGAAGTILEKGWIGPNKRIFDNTKVSDHFALIPTGTLPTGLDPAERRIYDLVCKRFLAAFYPPARFEGVSRVTTIEGEKFRTEGKILRDPGWLSVYGREAAAEAGADGEVNLAPVREGEMALAETIEVVGLATKPPPHFTEATLLSAMENAGKLVEEEQLREAMAKKGLGTPATRAAIIEGLVQEEYLRRQARELLATPKAFALFELLQAAGIPVLASPEMTGDWEWKLQQIERGSFTRPRFMEEIRRLTQQIVEDARRFGSAEAYAKPMDVKSPVDGTPLVETLYDYRSKGGFRISKFLAGRPLSREEVAALVQQGEIGPLSGFRSRSGQPFSARLKLGPDGKVTFVFSEKSSEGEARQILNEEPLGSCPVDGGAVYETATSYVCEHALKETPSCSFRIGKQILSREISREEVARLLKERKTGLLTGFLSRKTKRRFSAFLELKEAGKIGFAFEKRPPSSSPAKPGGRPTAKRTKKARARTAKSPDKQSSARGRSKRTKE
ncbi:DNA topoisomerase 3 [Methylacidimicrobium cyclopophantes]|uniref:DNA topoisomerase n=1 Tax=Methylacidimicrobium cyclopophantes TaxID=1041766 RepID=A0A5E6MHM6_9BACT|nr:DNA topoisomerase III [Methylacidimicrobium cyclopophantes]VVM04996.1 DNA topoisomerase 3 [Methylacidimicrobium cyclopophantes]